MLLASKRFGVLMLLLAAVVGLGACSGSSGTGGDGSASDGTPTLDGTQWSLSSIEDRSVVQGSHVSLYFREGTVWGISGCNVYGGEYTTKKGDKLAITDLGATELACISPDGIMDQESEYLEYLGNSVAYDCDDGFLHLKGQSEQVRLVFDRKQEFAMNPADLVGSVWRLVSINDSQILEGLSITLSFDTETEATGSAGCFDYTLYYEAAGDDIRCGMHSARTADLAEELDRQALQYTSSVKWAANYRLGTDILEIFTAKDDVLVFEPL